MNQSEIQALKVFADILIWLKDAAIGLLIMLACYVVYVLIAKFVRFVNEKWSARDGKSGAFHFLIFVIGIGVLVLILNIDTYIQLRNDTIPTDLVVPMKNLSKLTIVPYFTLLAISVAYYAYDVFDRNEKKNQKKADDKKK